MKVKRDITEFEELLGAVQGSIALYRRGVHEFFLSDGFPRYYEHLEAVRGDLETLGMYERCKDALTQAEALIRQGPEHDDEAEMLILNANRALMQASGNHEVLRSRYSAANDGPKTDDGT
jgi:hypothetical protein